MTAAYQATVHSEAVALATMPYALCGLGEHMIDHALPSPSDVEANSHGVRVWLDPDHVPAWRATTDTVSLSRKPTEGPWDSHTCEAVLHGSCVRVTFRWITLWPVCEHPECSDFVAPTDSQTYPAGCTHGRDLCAMHKLHCGDCVEELRETRIQSWGSDL